MMAPRSRTASAAVVEGGGEIGPPDGSPPDNAESVGGEASGDAVAAADAPPVRW